MKTIGIIGGTSWESTKDYYTVMNETIKVELGGLHSAKILLYSVDFAEVEAAMSTNNWDTCAAILITAAQSLEKGGADFILIASNTLHKVCNKIQSAISIPILHIVDVTAEVMLKDDINNTLLLGTRFTMEEDFYINRLKQCGLSVLVPDAADRKIVDDIIFKELCLGKVLPASKAALRAIIDKLTTLGAKSVILGCTELGMLLTHEDTDLPLYDTTLIHPRAAALEALNK